MAVKHVVQISSILGKHIATRNSLRAALEQYIDAPEEVIIDFLYVDFISRSCADEYIKIKIESENTFSEINMSPNVQNMLQFVSAERAVFLTAD